VSVAIFEVSEDKLGAFPIEVFLSKAVEIDQTHWKYRNEMNPCLCGVVVVGQLHQVGSKLCPAHSSVAIDVDFSKDFAQRLDCLEKGIA